MPRHIEYRYTFCGTCAQWNDNDKIDSTCLIQANSVVVASITMNSPHLYKRSEMLLIPKSALIDIIMAMCAVSL